MARSQFNSIESNASAKDAPNDDLNHSWISDHLGTSFRRSVSEFAGNISAGTAGVVAFSLLSECGVYGKALSVPVAVVAGGISDLGVKAAIQESILRPADRDFGSSDLLNGGLSALAGVTAGVTDRYASQSLLRTIGRRELGSSISDKIAQSTGQQIVKDSVLESIKFNALRGLTAGAVGSFTWSLPYRTFESAKDIQNHPLEGSLDLAKNVAEDTMLGTAVGGAFGAGATAFGRTPEIAGKLTAKIQGNNNLLHLDEHALNDVHSAVDMLSKAQTKMVELRQSATEKGIPVQSNLPGDLLASHVNFAFTKGDSVENNAVARMGFDNITPGNHEYDAEGGSFDVDRYARVMKPVLRDNPSMSLLNANLDLSSYPDYAALTKPYVVHEIAGPNGPEKLATVGLITDEGAVNAIKYNDAEKTALSVIRDLNSQGIKNIVLLTHLGLEHDQHLAQTILDNNLVVAKITGAHSHDITARPLWVDKKTSFLENLQFWKPKVSIPITQAGSHGEYLSETNLVIQPNGAADARRTTGRLHPLTDVRSDPELKSYVDSQMTDVQQLTERKSGASTASPYTLEGMRVGETPLANLIADSTLSGLSKHMGEQAPEVVLIEAGGIKTGLSSPDVNRRDLANMFMNAGKLEAEQKELVGIELTGRQLKTALEFALHIYPQEKMPTWSERVGNIFRRTDAVPGDRPGSFMQVAGLQYNFDATKPAWSRTGEVNVRTADGTYVPIADDNSYRVATRDFALTKWRTSKEPSMLAAKMDTLTASPIPISQVDLLEEHIRGRTLNPAVDGATDGRITNTRPLPSVDVVRPTFALASTAYVGEQATAENEQSSTLETKTKESYGDSSVKSIANYERNSAPQTVAYIQRIPFDT